MKLSGKSTIEKKYIGNHQRNPMLKICLHFYLAMIDFCYLLQSCSFAWIRPTRTNLLFHLNKNAPTPSNGMSVFCKNIDWFLLQFAKTFHYGFCSDNWNSLPWHEHRCFGFLLFYCVFFVWQCIHIVWFCQQNVVIQIWNLVWVIMLFLFAFLCTVHRIYETWKWFKCLWLSKSILPDTSTYLTYLT